MKWRRVPALALLGLVLSIPMNSFGAQGQTSTPAGLIESTDIERICRQCETHPADNIDRIHPELNKVVPIFCLERALRGVVRLPISLGPKPSDHPVGAPAGKPPTGLSHAGLSLRPEQDYEASQQADKRIFVTAYAESQPLLAQLINVRFPQEVNPRVYWLELIKHMNPACRSQIAFAYPEEYLLLPNMPEREKVFPASNKVCSEWGRALGKVSETWWKAPSDPTSLEEAFLPANRIAVFLGSQPQMSNGQWCRLKRAVRERWTSRLGKSRERCLRAILYQEHALDKLEEPKPFIGAHDLRGFKFDDQFQIVGCVLRDADLWNASFVGCRLPQAHIDGSGFADVECADAIFTEARIAASREKYGPCYSTFRRCKMDSSVWMDCCAKGDVFYGSNLADSRFEGCEFTSTLFLSCNLSGATFSGCKFGHDCRIIDCRLESVDFGDAVLREDLFEPIGDPAAFANKNLFDLSGPDCKGDDGGYVARMSADWVHNGGQLWRKAVEGWIRGSSNRARCHASQWHNWPACFPAGIEQHMLGFPQRIGYTLCLEEGCDDKSSAFMATACQVMENYRRSGRTDRYREEWARMQFRRKETGLERLVQGFEGITSGFFTAPRRFLAAFALALALCRFLRISLARCRGKKSQLQRPEWWVSLVSFVSLGVLLVGILASRVLLSMGIAAVVVLLGLLVTLLLYGVRDTLLSLRVYAEKVKRPLFEPHKDTVGMILVAWGAYESARLLSFWWGT